MRPESARLLLDEIGIFQHICDLDLLLFFEAHPRSLLTSESLSAFLGYELKQIAKSLEILITAGLLKRNQTPAHAARLYVLETDTKNDERLRSLFEVGSTRQGRATLRKALIEIAEGQMEIRLPSATYQSEMTKERTRVFRVRNQKSRRRGTV